MSHVLTWGLVIATYNREKILPTAIRYAVQQTRKPVEIVVVDASDNWKETCESIHRTILHDYPEIRTTYVPAETRSSACQRNQGIQIATADVLFMIDDDTFMYPDCAEKVMQVYEADRTGQIVGVQPAGIEQPPADAIVADERKQTGGTGGQFSRLGAIGDWLWKHVFLMNIEVLWIPYERQFPRHSIPLTVQHLNVAPARLLHGWRMTYRRSAIAAECFEPLLIYYAAAEDLDASYRVSRQGALVEASDAKAHHFYSGSGRINRFQVNAISVLNQALFLKKNSDNLGRDLIRFYILNTRRFVADLLKDLLSRRLTLPQVRGLLTGFWYAPTIFRQSLDDLKDSYPRLQRKLMQ